MGYFADQELTVLEMAHDMGDDYGQDAGTAETIAEVLGMEVSAVQLILEGDPDRDADCDDCDDGYALASAGHGMDEDY